ARGLGELGAVDGAAADQRERLRVEGHEDQRRDDRQADRADGDRVAVAEGLGVAGHQPPHPRSPLLSPSAGMVTPAGWPVSGSETGSRTNPPAPQTKKLNQLPLIAVRVIRSILVGASCRKPSSTSPVSARLPARSSSARMSAASGRRASSSRPV